MDKIFSNYKSLVWGGLTSLIVFIVLGSINFIILAPVVSLINVIGFVLCWLVISFFINRFPVYQVAGILSLLMVALGVEHYLRSPFNPVSIPLLTLFWLGVVYLVLPDFFKKYKMILFAVYGVALSYFLIFRTLPNYVDQHHQHFLNFLLVPIPVFAVLWLYEQWRWLNLLKADKTKAELDLLKNQINPHFFFNTLNNLYGLAVEKSDQTPAMILKLSEIMRYTIYNGKSDFVPLVEELKYLKDYIDLHKIRYQKKVDISFKEDLPYPHKIAPLLLIVPLENAFKHGVEPMASDTFIKIEISTTAKSILFRITNNYEPNPSDQPGIGLANLKKRLALIYPDRHHLAITRGTDTYSLSLTIETDELPNHR